MDESDGWLRDAVARLAVMDLTGALALVADAREAGASGPRLDALEARALAGLGREQEAARLAARALSDGGLDDEEVIAEARWARGLALARGEPQAARLDLVEALTLRQGAAHPSGAPVAADLAVLEAAAGLREDAEILLGDAVDALEAAGDALGVARVFLLAGDARRAAGDPRGAVDALVEADARLAGCAEESLLVQLWWRQAEVALDLDDAEQGLLFARRALSRAGNADPYLRGRLWGTVGRAHEASGDVGSALAAWRKSAELLETCADPLDARAEEAALAAAAGKLGELGDRLGEWAEQAARRPSDTAAVRFHALSLALAAAEGDRAAWSHHWRQVVLATTNERQLSPRLAEHLHFAAGQCGAWAQEVEHAPHPMSRVVRAEALALEVWNRLGRTGEAVQASRALHDLGASGAPIPAGPFDLVRLIGKGAMGEVWRARHHDRSLVVAVKVLAHTDPRLRELFHAEVKAAASLDHPNIVRVLGTGKLGPESEAVGHGQVRVESPWFAMELAEGGTLDPWCGRLAWSQCRAVLVSLLDALAHAHARGVVHLDLKPSNVLLRSAHGGVLLSDFGLAKVVDLQHRKSTVAGTPQSMAPEQFHGDSRDYGPWTDLYALGCLAVQLVTGEPPFPGATLEEQRSAHLGAPLPSLRPRIAVPRGLDGWILRLLEKDPAGRFQRAADAAFALSHLVDPPDGEVPEELPRHAFRDPGPSVSVNPVAGVPDPLPTHPAPVGAERARPGQRPPCSDDWRSVVETVALDDFADVALSLVGLRRPPLVGREAERDLLWSRLVAVARGRGPDTLVLRGPRGCGKSALARWLCERAHELGAATVLDAAPGPDGRSGLQAIVARHLRLEGLDDEEAARRIRLVFPDLPAPVVEDLAILVIERGVALSAVERVSALVAFASRLASGRPVVVRLGSASPAAPDQVLLARMLRASGAPVLVLLEEDGVPLAIDGAAILEVEPMSDEDLLVLLDAMVPLDPVVRAQLGELCGDNPDLLRRTLADLVQRDAFQRGTEGWRLRAGVKLALPLDVAALWAERVATVVQQIEPAARTALAGAACLGRALTQERFALVCEAVGTSGEGVIEASAGLLNVARGRAPRFEHPAVAAVLRGGYADLAAAQAAAQAVEHAKGAEALYATLLLQAGRLGEAVEPLLRGAEACLREGDTARATELLDRRGQILASLSGHPGPSDLDEALLRARLAHQAGSPDAETLAAIAAALAERASDPAALAEALLVKARETWKRGEADKALADLRRAVDAFGAAGDLSGTGRALREAGVVACSVGDLTSALSLHARAVQRLADGDPLARAGARGALAETWRQWGEIAKAERELTLALTEAGEGPSATRAEVLIVWGDVARTAGRYDETDSWYRKVLTALPWHDARRVREVQLRRALLAVAVGRLGDARVLVDGLIASSAVEGGPFVGRCRLVEFAVLARADDRTWSAQLDLVRPWLALCDRDVAWVLDQAGQRTSAAGKAERSLVLFEASAAIYRRMGLVLDEAGVERRAATLRRAR